VQEKKLRTRRTVVHAEDSALSDDAWDRFDECPGARLHWVKRNLLATNHDLVDSDGRCLASLEAPYVFGGGRYTVWIDQRPFQPVATKGGEWGEHHLVGETSGALLLKIKNRHYMGEALTVIDRPGQKSLRFPVDSKKWRRAVLSAIDERGKVVLQLRYRSGRLRRHLSSIECVVSEGEKLSPKMVAVVAVASFVLFPGFFDSGMMGSTG